MGGQGLVARRHLCKDLAKAQQFNARGVAVSAAAWAISLGATHLWFAQRAHAADPASHFQIFKCVANLRSTSASGARKGHFAVSGAGVKAKRGKHGHAQVAAHIGAHYKVGVTLHDPLRAMQRFKLERLVHGPQSPAARNWTGRAVGALDQCGVAPPN